MNTQDTMALLDEFLGNIEKVAITSTDPEATQPGASSNMDSEDIKKLEAESDGIKETQTNLGKEQAAEAKAGGATATETPENTDADAEDPVDGDAPKKLDIDQPLKGNSEVLGSVKTQSINMEQKLARQEKLASALISVIEAEVQKEASQEKTQKTAAQTPADIEDLLFEKLAQESAAAAQDYFESHLLGQITRVRDEMELTEANLDPAILKQHGGVGGLLDKVAMETPEAVLPEGLAPDAGGMPPEALAGGMPPEMPPEAMGAEMPLAEAPVEGEDMGGGEEISEDELDQLADALDQAGVTPEDLEQAFTDISALQEAGVQPDELAQAIEQLSAEDGGGDMGGEPAPAVEDAGEAMPEEEVAPAEEEKVASDNRRIQMLKAILKR